MVRNLALTLCLATALLCSGVRAPGQDTPPPTVAKTGDFFSGIVVSVSSTELTVNRRGLGKDSAVTKSFLIDEKTKIEGSLKAKAHVTVRFLQIDNQAKALHIIVR